MSRRDAIISSVPALDLKESPPSTIDGLVMNTSSILLVPFLRSPSHHNIDCSRMRKFCIGKKERN
jgi:hypothetical protein